MKIPDHANAVSSVFPGPLVDVRVSVARSPWRLGPAWSVVAGALAGGGLSMDVQAALRLVGAVLLADSAWGILWRVALGARGATLQRRTGSAALPYLQPEAPAAHVIRGLEQLASGGSWHELVIGAALAIGLGALLGPVALLLGILALAVTVLGGLYAVQGSQPLFARAVLGIALPWMMGMASGNAYLRDGWLDGLLLGGAFTVLCWGVQRTHQRAERGGGWTVWLGQALVLVVLIVLGQQLAVALCGVLFLFPSWCLLRTAADAEDLRSRLGRSGPWWWAAALSSAMLIGQALTFS